MKAAKKARSIEEKTVFLLRCGEKAAFRRRPRAGLLAGMWELPNVEGVLPAAQASAQAAQWGAEPLCAVPAGKAVHVFTHKEWHMQGFRIECGREAEAFAWMTRSEFEAALALPSAFRDFSIFCGAGDKNRGRQTILSLKREVGGHGYCCRM